MSKKMLVAYPRGWCAGVDRAVEIVERALLVYGAPIFVRKQIVHNLHVVRQLEAKGAVFVESEEEVPPGSVLVLSAHGVAPSVYENSRSRNLKLVDATCPLVTKVHVEARRFAGQGKTIFLIGHLGHEEIEGTSGQAPEQIVVIEQPQDLEGIEVLDPDNVAYLTQTTLAVDETQRVILALKKRFPSIAGPKKDDICYASQNRQDAVKVIARQAEVVFVVGSKSSSNSNRLVEVARQAGAHAYLIEDETSIRRSWLETANVIGVTSGASTPDELFERVVEFLKSEGVTEVQEVRVATENVHFPLPATIQ